MKKYLKVTEQKLMPHCIVRTLEDGQVIEVPYCIDENGDEYCETDPELIKVEVDLN